MKTRLTEAVETVFKRHFGYKPPHVVSVPGSLQILGDHTACHEGIVITAAVNRYVFVACAPRTDGRIELVCPAFPGRELFWMSEMRKNPDAPWADHLKGVLVQLRKRGVAFSGFNAAIDSTIPPGIGINSSVAMTMAAALAVRKLYPFSLTETGATIPPKRNEKGDLPPIKASERMHFARLCQAAEREFAGGRGSLSDHASVALGKAWHVMSIDCRFTSVEHAPLIGEAVIVCDSGERPEPDINPSEELRALCVSAAQKLGAKSLRSVELKHLQACKPQLEPREYECAFHVVGEIARVVAGERALREDDHRQFGQYLFQSHESCRTHFKNSCPGLDTLVELARKHPGCLGARQIGDGFGGATVNIVAYHQAQRFIESITNGYQSATGRQIEPLVCQIVDGAG